MSAASMDALSLIFAIIGAMVVANFMVIALRVFMLVTRRDSDQANAVPDIDPAHYRPMMRQLSDYDLDPDCTPAERRRIRAARRRVFRACLQSLAADHARLMERVRWHLITSEVDPAGFSRALQRNRKLFIWGLFRVEFCLLLHAFDIRFGDLSDVFAPLLMLRAQASVWADSTVWGS